jgi:predicted glycosyl hydrolase (DUF1957 family)
VQRTRQISKTDVPDVVFDLVSEAAIAMVQAMQNEPQVKSAVVYYGGRERVATEAEWDEFQREIAALSGKQLVDRLALGYSQFTKDIWRQEIKQRYDEAATVLVTKELTEVIAIEGQKPTVIVLNLTAPGGYMSVDGEQWANRLTTRLVQTQRMQVVERERIAQIIREQNFSNTDLVEESTRIKLGKLAGASVVIMGSISQTLTIKAVDAETGVVKYAITLNRPF